MVKKIVASILSSLLIISTVGCTNNGVKNDDVAPMTVDRRVDLPGTWAKDYSRDEVTELHKEILRRVEDVVVGYGFTEDEYEIKHDAIKEENGISTNSSYLNLDVENPEANRLESVYYGFKQYGSDLATGDLSMTLSFTIDKKVLAEIGQFKFEETSISSFSQAFTNVTDRDYSELNEKIYDMIMGNIPAETIENNLDGIKESITVGDGFILYKLQTKEYNFK